jgi:signal transduction histidine kinase
MKSFLPRLGKLDDLTSLPSSLTGRLLPIIIVSLGMVTFWGYLEIQWLSPYFTEKNSTFASQRLLLIGALITVILSVLIQKIVRYWLRPLEQNIRSKEKQQQQLINDLSHELRSPLSMVYSYLQRCQKQSQDLSPVQKESLDMAVADAERMTQLLEGWLNLARLDAQTIVTLNLNEILLETALMLEKLTKRAINVQLPRRIIEVKGDRSRLMQVFDHLLDNAIYYSHEPVTVTLKVVQKEAVAEVSDRGCGISPENIERIFDPLYRIDASRSRTTGGFGLGLPYVKRAIESLGGSIEVKSSLGVGSCLIVKLPL